VPKGRESKSVKRLFETMTEHSKYDWAKAMLALVSKDSSDLSELAQAAELDPKAGDLTDIDLSDLDLSDQNLEGWDLRNAKFSNTRLARAELRNALVDPNELAEAVDWEEALLDDGVRWAARNAAILSTAVDELELSVRAANCLKVDSINYIGELVQKTEGAMLRIPYFGRKTLHEIKKVLASMGLHFGMDLPNWRPKERKGYAPTLITHLNGEQARESRLRRACRKVGYKLIKSRKRGVCLRPYHVVFPERNWQVSDSDGMTLEDAEDFVSKLQPQTSAPGN
jgi:hypothetical protein